MKKEDRKKLFQYLQKEIARQEYRYWASIIAKAKAKKERKK